MKRPMPRGGFSGGPGAGAKEEQEASAQSLKRPAAPPGLGDLAALQQRLAAERGALESLASASRAAKAAKTTTREAPGAGEKVRTLTRAEQKAERDAEQYQAETGDLLSQAGKELMVEAKIGSGHFSRVFRVRDEEDGQRYAVKVTRANETVRQRVAKEVELLNFLQREALARDPEGAAHLCLLVGLKCFEQGRHKCLVFDVQFCDLRVALRKYGHGKGFALTTVRRLAKQFFLALRALRRVRIVHTDVKPDNLLLSAEPDRATLRLADFGSAILSESGGAEDKSGYAQPRYYRAPEVMLGQPYGAQIDIWSAGATLFEAATGRILFAAKTNNAMLHELLKVCGAMPAKMVAAGTYVDQHFTSQGDFRDGERDKVIPMSDFTTPLEPVLKDLEGALPSSIGVGSKKLVRKLASFITGCLSFDPVERSTPDLALEHAVFDASS